MFPFKPKFYFNDISTVYTVSYRLPNGCKGTLEIKELNEREAKEMAKRTLPKKTLITKVTQKGCL